MSILLVDLRINNVFSLIFSDKICANMKKLLYNVLTITTISQLGIGIWKQKEKSHCRRELDVQVAVNDDSNCHYVNNEDVDITDTICCDPRTTLSRMAAVWRNCNLLAFRPHVRLELFKQLTMRPCQPD